MANRLTPLSAMAYAPIALAADLVVPRRSAAREPGDFNSRWLERILGLSEGSVTRSEVREIDHGTSLRVRLEIFHSNTSTSVFVKQTPTRMPARLFNSMTRLCEHEVHFYKHLSRETGCAPTALAAEWHALTGRSTLVLPDLRQDGYSFLDVADLATADQAALAVEAMADLHRRFWCGGDFGLAGEYRPQNSVSPYVTPFLCRYLGGGPSIIVDQLQAAFIDELRTLRTHASAFPALFNSFDQTLIHNDSHQGNIAYRADKVTLLDWQVCCVGSALKDFAYFLASADSAMRRKHERELLQHYLAVLSAGDGPVIGWDDAWRAYRILVITGFIAAAATALAGDRLQNSANAKAGLERTATALVDLESFKTVQRQLSA
ncbi:phosphotransferase [Mycobacterium syngnathidarum]